MTGLHLDFVIFAGDPDAGAAAIPSAKMLADWEKHKSALSFPDVYGAIVISKGNKEIAERKADTILTLITSFVKSLPYIIDGESETVLLSESANGFLFEPSGDDIFFSFFAGDAYEPDEYFVEHVATPLGEFGEQVLSMGERLRDLIKKVDPAFYERDEYLKSLNEFLDMGRKALKTFKLEVERGLRIQ